MSDLFGNNNSGYLLHRYSEKLPKNFVIKGRSYSPALKAEFCSGLLEDGSLVTYRFDEYTQELTKLE